MAAAARIDETTWARRAPAFALALLALLGHLLLTLHFAAHAHVYCPVHQRMEHASAALDADHAAQGGGCCGHDHGSKGPDGGRNDDGKNGGGQDGGGQDDDGEHDACGMQPPGKLAEVPTPFLGALLGDAVAARALLAPVQQRHGLDPLTMAPKHSPPLS